MAATASRPTKAAAISRVTGDPVVDPVTCWVRMSAGPLADPEDQCQPEGHP